MTENEKGFEDKLIARGEVIILLDKYISEKLYGGFEVKIENGNITYLKDWRGRKFKTI